MVEGDHPVAAVQIPVDGRAVYNHIVVNFVVIEI